MHLSHAQPMLIGGRARAAVVRAHPHVAVARFHQLWAASLPRSHARLAQFAQHGVGRCGVAGGAVSVSWQRKGAGVASPPFARANAHVAQDPRHSPEPTPAAPRRQRCLPPAAPACPHLGKRPVARDPWPVPSRRHLSSPHMRVCLLLVWSCCVTSGNIPRAVPESRPLPRVRGDEMKGWGLQAGGSGQTNRIPTMLGLDPIQPDVLVLSHCAPPASLYQGTDSDSIASPQLPCTPHAQRAARIHRRDKAPPQPQPPLPPPVVHVLHLTLVAQRELLRHRQRRAPSSLYLHAECAEVVE